jgi:hypothetical protein
MLPLFSISLELEVHQDLSKGDAFLWDPLPDSLFCLGRFTVELSKWWDFEKPPRQLLLCCKLTVQNFFSSRQKRGKTISPELQRLTFTTPANIPIQSPCMV